MRAHSHGHDYASAVVTKLQPDRSALQPRPSTGGVNVVGFFRAEFGQGEAARRLVAALERTGIPFSTVTYDRVPHRQSHPFDDRAGETLHASNILCLNAEHLLRFVQGEERELLRGRYSAGLWFWETDRLPRQVRPALDFVDEVWVASDFVRETIQAETEKPVLTMPLPVVVTSPAGLTRADVGIAGERHRLSLRLRLLQHDRAQESDRPDRGLQAGFPGARRHAALPEEHQRRAFA